MSSAFGAVLNLVADLMWLISKIMLCCITPFLVMICLFMFIKVCKKQKLPRKLGENINKRGNIFKRLLWDFPKLLVDDLYNKDPNNLDMYGFHLFCGEQGSGKSIAIVEFLIRLKKRYPFIKIRSNIELAFQDEKIHDWRDLVFNNNGEKGQVEFLDETQNWFNSNESKDFPPEMIQDVCQQRKQRKMIVGSAQVFQRVAKPLREQTTLLYRPFTIAGCLTFVRVYKPKLDENGTCKELRMRKVYFFVHTKEIREAYDTYERVQRISLKGFQPRNQQIGSINDTAICNSD